MADEVLKDEPAVDDASAPGAEPPGELQREKEALQDRLLRTAAEFDNYRKRMDRERRDLADYVSADLLSELLPILDNFERALQAPAAADSEPFRKGIELIHRQLLDLLKKRGVTPIEAQGADFDPNFHQVERRQSGDIRAWRGSPLNGKPYYVIQYFWIGHVRMAKILLGRSLDPVCRFSVARLLVDQIVQRYIGQDCLVRPEVRFGLKNIDGRRRRVELIHRLNTQ